VRADERLTAFVELQSAIRERPVNKISGRVRKRASPLLFRQSRQKRGRTPRTFATRACDHCNRKGGRDRSARSLLGAMPTWGRSPDLLLCDQVLLSRRRCGIAFQARSQASLPVKGVELRHSARNPRLCSPLPPNSRSTKMFIAHSRAGSPISTSCLKS